MTFSAQGSLWSCCEALRGVNLPSEVVLTREYSMIWKVWEGIPMPLRLPAIGTRMRTLNAYLMLGKATLDKFKLQLVLSVVEQASSWKLFNQLQLMDRQFSSDCRLPFTLSPFAIFILEDRLEVAWTPACWFAGGLLVVLLLLTEAEVALAFSSEPLRNAMLMTFKVKSIGLIFTVILILLSRDFTIAVQVFRLGSWVNDCTTEEVLRWKWLMTQLRMTWEALERPIQPNGFTVALLLTIELLPCWFTELLLDTTDAVLELFVALAKTCTVFLGFI